MRRLCEVGCMAAFFIVLIYQSVIHDVWPFLLILGIYSIGPCVVIGERLYQKYFNKAIDNENDIDDNPSY